MLNVNENWRNWVCLDKDRVNNLHTVQQQNYCSIEQFHTDMNTFCWVADLIVRQNFFVILCKYICVTVTN